MLQWFRLRRQQNVSNDLQYRITSLFIASVTPSQTFEVLAFHSVVGRLVYSSRPCLSLGSLGSVGTVGTVGTLPCFALPCVMVLKISASIAIFLNILTERCPLLMSLTITGCDDMKELAMRGVKAHEIMPNLVLLVLDPMEMPKLSAHVASLCSTRLSYISTLGLTTSVTAFIKVNPPVSIAPTLDDLYAWWSQ